jgi:hypothetical protein
MYIKLMTYYIVMPKDNVSELWDENTLGESSFGTFYTGRGMEVLKNMIGKHPAALSDISIIDEKNNSYTVIEFLELLSNWKIKES